MSFLTLIDIWILEGDFLMKNNDVLLGEVVLRAKSKYEYHRSSILKRQSLIAITLIATFAFSILKIVELELPHHLPNKLSYGTSIQTDASIGAYVTIGVVMFVVGMTFTIICIKIKEKGEKKI